MRKLANIVLSLILFSNCFAQTNNAKVEYPFNFNCLVDILNLYDIVYLTKTNFMKVVMNIIDWLIIVGALIPGYKTALQGHPFYGIIVFFGIVLLYFRFLRPLSGT